MVFLIIYLLDVNSDRPRRIVSIDFASQESNVVTMALALQRAHPCRRLRIASRPLLLTHGNLNRGEQHTLFLSLTGGEASARNSLTLLSIYIHPSQVLWCRSPFHELPWSCLSQWLPDQSLKL
ncbi:hypothetical protein BYT27DRAFT_6686652 [Phlegmacium glaucopus]|nr:hypothetical protein BYT27DRAFT_6686652 [Phlegmacium glaucopus]